MTEFVGSSGDEMAFFKGRQWLPRGVRYPAEEAKTDTDVGGGGEEGDRGVSGGTGGSSTPSTAAESAEEALEAAVAEVELAYHESRLRGAVHAALALLQKNAEAAAAAAAARGGSGEEDRTAVAAGAAAAESAATAQAAVRAAAAILQSPSAKGEVVGAVDTLCAVAENEADAVTAAAKDALDALIGFAASGDGPGETRAYLSVLMYLWFLLCSFIVLIYFLSQILLPRRPGCDVPKAEEEE